MMTLHSFLRGCFFGCKDHVRERRGKSYLLVCPTCGSSKVILKGQKLKVKAVRTLAAVTPMKRKAG